MDEKELVKDRNDIADTVREYLELKPAGSRSFKAICPFHAEKTPSLHISQEKQIWHCFGCGKGGDVISFVMEMQGVDFREALEQLARKAGITLTQQAPNPEDGARKTIFDLNDQAATFYEKILHEHELGAEGRAYLEKRGIDIELAKKFRLGFAPKAWDVLIRSFEKKGVGKDRLLQSGLAKRGTKGDVIDLFRERFMIPIRDIQGRVLGFTGRAIQADQFGPKYLNTSETVAFKKRAVLHGLYEGRTAIRLENKIIVTEGNIDIISSHKAGVEYIVASSGTALTEEHISAIKRLTENILFCFDADAAGFRAAQKGIRLAQDASLRVQVIRIPRDLGKDPDEVVRKSPEAWRKVVNEPIPIMQFYIEELQRVHNTQTPEGKSAFVKAAADEAVRTKDTVERGYWSQRIADMAHVSVAQVEQVIQSLLKDMAVKKLADAAQKPSTQGGALKSQPVQSAPQPAPKQAPKPPQKQDRTTMLFWELMCAILEINESPSNYIQEHQIPKNFRELYKTIVDLYTNAVASADPQQSKQHLLAQFITPETSFLRAIMIRTEELQQVKEHNTREQIKGHVTSLSQIARDERKQELEADIRIAEQKGDQVRLQELLAEYQTLIQ